MKAIEKLTSKINYQDSRSQSPDSKIKSLTKPL